MTYLPFENKELVPVVKLGEPLTYAPWTVVPVKSIAVKMHDLLRSNGKSFKLLFKEIEEAGGLHAFLGFNGNILLSMVMSDKKIFGCSHALYTDAINRLKPDFFTTLDGETYENELGIAEKEIQRIVSESKKLIAACPNSVPIGLVKGASTQQVLSHLMTLQDIGVTRFMFHAGDFLASGSHSSVSQAVRYARQIQKFDSDVIVYGLGSRKNLRRFWFGGAFITQTHYISAFNGIQIVDGHFVNINEKPSQEIILNNLKEIHNIFSELKKGGITKWVEETVAIGHTTQLNAMKIKALDQLNNN